MKIKLSTIIDYMIAFIILLFIYKANLLESTSIDIIITILGFILQIYNLIFLEKHYKIYLIQCLFFIFGLFNRFLIGNNTYLLLSMTVLVGFPVAYYFNFSKINLKFWRSISIFIFLIISYFFLKNYGKYQFFLTASRNYISIYLLLALFLYILSYSTYNADTNPKNYFLLLYSFIILVMSTLSVGRGGILSTGLIFSLFLYKLLFQQRITIYQMLLWCLFVFIILFLANNNSIILQYLSRFVNVTEITVKNSNNERMTMLSNYYYIFKDSLKYFLFGAPVRTGLFKTVNLHNSFFQIHANYGVIPILILSITLVKTSLRLFYTKKNYLLIFLVGYLIRSLTDHVFMGTLFDFVIIYYMMYCFTLRKESQG